MIKLIIRNGNKISSQCLFEDREDTDTWMESVLRRYYQFVQDKKADYNSVGYADFNKSEDEFVNRFMGLFRDDDVVELMFINYDRSKKRYDNYIKNLSKYNKDEDYFYNNCLDLDWRTFELIQENSSVESCDELVNIMLTTKKYQIPEWRAHK